MTPETRAPDTSPVEWDVPLHPEVELRVLQGPQAGSRLSLAAGQTYSLGTSDDCSIVLAGPQVQPEHARVMTQADMVEITAVDGSVVIDGIELTNDSGTWELGGLFLLGRVALCVDQTDVPWPSETEIAARIAHAQEGPEDDEADDPVDEDDSADPTDDPDLQDEPEKDDDDDDDDDDIDDTVQDPSGQRTPATPGVPGRLVMPLQASGQGRARRTLMRTLTISGLALAGALAVVVWLSLGEPPMVATAAPAGIGIDGLSASTSAPAAPSPTPPPPTEPAPPSAEAVATRLDALVKELQIPDRQTARWTLREGRPHLQIATTDTGGIEALRNRITSLQAETGPIDLDVLGPADIARQFREALETVGLHRKFDADPGNPEALHFKASLTQDEVPRWERLFLSFTERYGNVPPVTVQINTDFDRLGHQIGSVVGGAFPYIVTPEGHRIAPGGRLMGRTVISVQTGEVVFADGLRYRFIQ